MSETVPMLFDNTVKRFGKRPAIQYFCAKSQKWIIKNWADLATTVSKLANGIKGTGVLENERIALLSRPRPEWVMSDIAIMKASCIVVPIYHSSLSDQIAYILSDADAQIIFLEDEAQLKKVRQLKTNGSRFSRVVVFDRVEGPLLENEIYFEDFIKNQPDQFQETSHSPSTIASLVYTSGTTGEPKGAIISHDNLLYAAQVIDKLGLLTSEDVQLIFLPLAHIFARVLELAWIRTGHLLAFASSVEEVVSNMAEIKPTFMAGVPRIFEKVRAKAIESALKNGGIKGVFARFAFKEADRVALYPHGKDLRTSFAKKLVFEKIGRALSEKFGGRLRFLVSGGAQLAPEVFSFFELAGITLCEGYGLTETTAATCLNLPWELRSGSVGKPLPGTEVTFSDEQEILVKGRGVFLGFFKKDPETKEVFDVNGWFHTGDIGRMDKDGFIYIVDRKRDIIVTSQGKNIAPQRVENLIKSKAHIIGHVVVIGDRRPYLTALIALDPINAKALAFPKGAHPQVTMAELAANISIYQEVKSAVNLANLSLASFEQIKRFSIVDREFEVGKELTPTLKVKRKWCATQYKKEISMLYA